MILICSWPSYLDILPEFRRSRSVLIANSKRSVYKRRGIKCIIMGFELSHGTPLNAHRCSPTDVGTCFSSTGRYVSRWRGRERETRSWQCTARNSAGTSPSTSRFCYMLIPQLKNFFRVLYLFYLRYGLEPTPLSEWKYASTFDCCYQAPSDHSLDI